MKKVTTVRRPKFADEKYLGPEPTVNPDSTNMDFALAYNWYNYFYNSEDAKSFTLSYLKSIKYDKQIIQKISKAKPWDLHSIGWNCRLLSQGSKFPEGRWEGIEKRIRVIADSITIGEDADDEKVEPVKVISIQDRINAKTSDLIGELEEQLDVFFKAGVVQFDVKKWSVDKAIKPQIAKKIADHFRPQFEEISTAIEGKDKELAESYKGWRKPILKIMAMFIKRIIDHMTELESAAIAVRKPRKKKVKPVSDIVSKLKYMESHDKLKSVNPTEIVGASQVWVFNTKTRNLSVYNAVGNSGLTVRGSTIIGYDETSSITKKLRANSMDLPVNLNTGQIGKVALRSVMSSIRTKENKANGRINADTILLKVMK